MKFYLRLYSPKVWEGFSQKWQWQINKRSIDFVLLFGWSGTIGYIDYEWPETWNAFEHFRIVWK